VRCGCSRIPLRTAEGTTALIDAHIWQQEHSCARAAVSSANHGRRIELFTQVLDLKNLSSAHQRCLKYTKMLFANDAAFYPERLGALYVVNAPWIFPVWGDGP
jgi:hypothetical protein